jgi:uncharacterized protein
MYLDKTMPLVKSGFIQIIKDNEDIIIWHSLFGSPKVISLEAQDFLNLFTSPRTLNSIYEEYELEVADEDFIKEMIAAYYLIPEGFDERNLLAEKIKSREESIVNGSLIDNLELIMAEICNFRCTYCIHFNNLETSDRLDNANKIMSFDTAKEAVDGFLGILGKQGKRVARGKVRKLAEINFGGGEPLLAWPVIKQVLRYCRSNYGDKFVFKFSINTNASLLTPEIARELKEYGVEIASSLDGLHEANDRVRLTKSGEGTFDSIIDGFDKLASEDYPISGFAFTVNEKNFDSLNEGIIDWASKRGMRELRIDIDVIDMVDIPVEEIVTRLIKIRGYAKKYGIEVFGFWSRPAENLNDPTIEVHVAFCGAVAGNSMCVSPSGKIYSCGYSTTQIGTLKEIRSFHASGSQYHCFVKDRFTGAMQMCKGCMIEGSCGGGCNITQEFARASKTSKVERMCEFYRSMTRELLLEQLRQIQ